MDQSEQIGLVTTFSVIILIGLIGNGLVCTILGRNKFLCRKKPANYVLLNLAIADIIVLVFLAPRHAIFNLFKHPLGSAGDYLCKFVTGGNIAWIGAVTSALSLVFIAFERYYAVVKPHQYSIKFQRKFTKKVLFLCWFFAFCFCLPLFFVERYDEKSNFCVEDWNSTLAPQCYAVLWFVTAGVIPVCVMIFLYSNVIFVLWFKKNIDRTAHLTVRRARRKTRKRVSKALLAISFIYCASWFPPLTNYMLVYFQSNYSFSNIAYLASVVMVTFNSSVNPVIYAFYSGLFRKHLKEFVHVRKRVKRRNRGDQATMITLNIARYPMEQRDMMSEAANKRSFLVIPCD